MYPCRPATYDSTKGQSLPILGVYSKIFGEIPIPRIFPSTMTYSTTWYNSTVSTNSCFTIYFTVSRVCRQQMQLGGVFWDSAVEYALVIINFICFTVRIPGCVRCPSTRIMGGSGILTPLVIELCRMYADMSQSSGTPWSLVRHVLGVMHAQ